MYSEGCGKPGTLQLSDFSVVFAQYRQGRKGKTGGQDLGGSEEVEEAVGSSGTLSSTGLGPGPFLLCLREGTMTRVEGAEGGFCSL